MLILSSDLQERTPSPHGGFWPFLCVYPGRAHRAHLVIYDAFPLSLSPSSDSTACTEITGVFVGPSLLCPERQLPQTDDRAALWSNFEVGLHKAANRGGFSSRGWPEETLFDEIHLLTAV